MAVPTQQKALRLQEHAGAYAVDTVPVAMLEPGEILVRVEAASLNPVDWKTRFNRTFVITSYPAKQGIDVAGTVVQLGEGVTRFNVGDKVVHLGAFSEKLAAFQQYTAVSEDLAAKVPKGFSLEQAATIPLALVTAAVSLHHPKVTLGGGAAITPFWHEDSRDEYSGQPIVILGGSSSVGQYALQLAKLSGFSTIITTASPKHTALLKTLGATHVIDRSLSPEKVIAETETIAQGPVRIVYDAVSDPETQELGYKIVAPGGLLVVVNPVAITEQTADKEVILAFGTVHLPGKHREFGVELFQHLTKWFEEGTLKSTEAERVEGGLAAMPVAQDRVRAGLVGPRKLVINPQETA